MSFQEIPSKDIHKGTEEHQGYFLGGDATKLFYRSWLPAEDAVLASVFISLNGYGSHSRYSSKLGYFLTQKNHAVYSFDRRGLGASEGNPLTIRSLLGHLEDISRFHALVRKHHPGLPIFFVGESLGGALALEYAAKFGDQIHGLILLAPMVDICIRIFFLHPQHLATFLRFALLLLYRLFRKDMLGPIPGPFPISTITQDKAIVAEIEQDRGYLKKGNIYGGLLLQCLALTVLAEATKIKTPVLILQGDDDHLLDPSGAKKLFQLLSSERKELHLFPHGQHLLLYDPNASAVLAHIEAWSKSLMDTS